MYALPLVFSQDHHDEVNLSHVFLFSQEIPKIRQYALYRAVLSTYLPPLIGSLRHTYWHLKEIG